MSVESALHKLIDHLDLNKHTKEELHDEMTAVEDTVKADIKDSTAKADKP
jgi:hypothetical protein